VESIYIVHGVPEVAVGDNVDIALVNHVIISGINPFTTVCLLFKDNDSNVPRVVISILILYSIK
jgi:hypothetical protein